MTTYSICMTTKNAAATLDASLKSILSQGILDYEVIIVDSESTDGSLQILRKYENEGKIKLIIKKCSRGKGREIAFENSSGEYIIANLDSDEIYSPHLNGLIDFYHAKCENMVLLNVYDATPERRWIQNVTITTRGKAKHLGGWHDLQYGEDWEFWARAAKAGSYAWHVFPLVERFNKHSERLTTSNRLRYRYIRYREAKRCGRPMFRASEPRSGKQKLFEILVSITTPFYENYRDVFNSSFNCYAEKYRVSY
jgi:glycosyltransferase involved in cell wall biosynthesis